jgi:hypothetical protein
MDANAASLIEIIKWISTATPATIFAFMWWLERKERVELYRHLLKTTETMQAMNEAWMKILPPTRQQKNSNP